MRDYYNCLNENFDENGNVISETDLEKIGNVILKTFIQKVLDQRENPDTYDRKLEPISEMASNIRKQLFLIKQLSIQFANSVEDQYNQINIDTEDKKSIVTRMTEIKDLLNSELKKIKIDNF